MEALSDTYRNARLGPVEQCIYCGALGVPLSDEHIIPFSLDGTIQLTRASCAACAKITAKMEGTIGRTMFGNMRIKHGLPTRRKKDRPATLQAFTEAGAARERVELNVEDHAAPTPLIWLGNPGILVGRSPLSGCPLRVTYVLSKGIDPKRLNADSIVYEMKVDFKAFGRFLAKVGHGFAVASLGMDGFKPALSNIILNPDSDPYWMVGGEPYTEPPRWTTAKTTAHEVSVHGAQTRSGMNLVVVRIRFFANWYDGTRPNSGMPVYLVVVGHENESTQARYAGDLFYPRLS